MSHSDMSHAMETLQRKLKQLSTLTEANSFLVRALRDHEKELRHMSQEDTLALLRTKARSEYRETAPSHCGPDALDMIEEVLGNGHSAQIIPFPKRRVAR